MNGRYVQYARLRPSGEQWLGEIPMGWQAERLKTLFKIRKDIAGRLGFDVLSVTQKGLKQKDLTSGEGQLSMDYSKYQIVAPDDFVMNHMDLLTGYIDIALQEGVTSPDYRVFVPLFAAHMEARYYLYIFQMCYQNRIFYPLGQGSAQLGRWRLPRKAFEGFVLPIPSLVEQTQIAKFLDYETAKIDALIEKQQQLIALLKEKRQAVISHAVTKGLTNSPGANLNAEGGPKGEGRDSPSSPDAPACAADRPMRDSGVEWLGEVPAHWEVTRLKRLVRKLTDGEHISPTFTDEGMRFLSAKDVGERIINYDVEKFVDYAAGLRFRRRCNPEPGDVLVVSRGATIGRVGLVESDIIFCLLGSVILLKPLRETVDSIFLYYLLNQNAAREQFLLASQASAQQAVYLVDVAEMKIACPPKDEQIAIRDYLEVATNKVTHLLEKADETVLLLQERRTALISAAVTGKIDVRGWKAPESEMEAEPA